MKTSVQVWVEVDLKLKLLSSVKQVIIMLKEEGVDYVSHKLFCFSKHYFIAFGSKKLDRMHGLKKVLACLFITYFQAFKF